MEKREPPRSTPARPPVLPERERTPHGSIEFRVHPGDVTVELRGHSAEELFRLAAWALARTQMPDFSGETTLEDVAELESDGWDDLLVNWMNQLLFLAERHRAVWTDIQIRRLKETGLEATVRGRPWPERTEDQGADVKSASYVGLELVPGPSLWMARVMLEL